MDILSQSPREVVRLEVAVNNLSAKLKRLQDQMLGLEDGQAATLQKKIVKAKQERDAMRRELYRFKRKLR